MTQKGWHIVKPQHNEKSRNMNVWWHFFSWRGPYKVVCCYINSNFNDWFIFSGDPSQTTPPTVIVPESVSFSPPPYSGDNTGVPHPGPPPYSLGSGSSINSTTLPRCPPPYQQVTKEPPPSYSSTISIALPEDEEKKNSTTEDKRWFFSKARFFI